MRGSSVHPGLLGTLDKAIILEVQPLLPDSAIGDLIKQHPSTYIGTVPSGCGYNFSCNLCQIDCLPQLKSSTCLGSSTQSCPSPKLIVNQKYRTQPVQSIIIIIAVIILLLLLLSLLLFDVKTSRCISACSDYCFSFNEIIIKKLL